MDNFKWRVRTSALWVIYSVAWAGYMILDLIRPGVIDEIMARELAGVEINSALLVFLALSCWLVPLATAFLSLILTDTATRWTSIVLGVLSALLNVTGVGEEILKAEPAAVKLLMGPFMIVVATLIAWHAWKWPVQEQ